MQKARTMLLEGEAKRLLRDAGIAVPNFIEVFESTEAADRSRHLQFPVVAKAMVGGLAHKSEVGGVHVGLENPEAVEAAVAQIVSSISANLGADRLDGVLIEEMAGSGTELLVGSSEDAVFGTLLAFGVGGVFTETLEDVAFRAVPLQPWDPYEMVAELRAAPLFAGARGRPPIDLDEVARLLLSVGGPKGLLCDGVVHSIELNPVLATAAGLVTVDAVIEKDGEAVMEQERE